MRDIVQAVSLMNCFPEEPNFYAESAIVHVEYLAGEMCPRPSTCEGESRTAEYFAKTLREAGLQNVRCESFGSARSTYLPYLLAFGAALLGGFVYWKSPSRKTAVFGALAHTAAGGVLRARRVCSQAGCDVCCQRRRVRT